GYPYCSLEFVEGGNLSQRLNGNPLPAAQAAQIAEQLARAIEVAHAHHIVHRDLKPSNILLTSDGQPKITDFGLAKWMDSDPVQTRTGAVMGTPGYMAPEQAEGKKNVGPAADVYGLGAILYDCLTGRPPFRAATPLETVVQVVTDDPVPPSRLVPKLPRDLETICLKCLQKDPRRRYASAAELADDLRRFLDGRPVLARPTGLIEKAWKAAKRRPGAAAGIGVVVLAVAAVVGVIIWKNRQLERERDDANSARELAEINERIAAHAKELAQVAEEIAAVDKQLAELQRHRAEARLLAAP